MGKENATLKQKKVGKKQKDPKDFTTCEATERMLIKARMDGVETAFDRADSMKACPIGANSACCKHCAIGISKPPDNGIEA